MRSSLTAFAVAICMVTGIAGFQHARSDIEAGAKSPGRFRGWMARRSGVPLRHRTRGDEIEVYVRRSRLLQLRQRVRDDEESTRRDLDPDERAVLPSGAGKAVRVADMPGRLRSYDSRCRRLPNAAVGIAGVARCDLWSPVRAWQGRGGEVQRGRWSFSRRML